MINIRHLAGACLFALALIVQPATVQILAITAGMRQTKSTSSANACKRARTLLVAKAIVM
jgi:hypothetical protein